MVGVDSLLGLHLSIPKDSHLGYGSRGAWLAHLLSRLHLLIQGAALGLRLVADGSAAWPQVSLLGRCHLHLLLAYYLVETTSRVVVRMLHRCRPH